MPAAGWKNRVSAAFELHPYHPPGLVLPGWQPSVLSHQHLISVFFLGAGLLGGIAWLLSGRVRGLQPLDRALIVWFASCAVIHTVVEGNVVLNPKFFADSSGNFLNEIWKEYAKADSRYATRESFTICMEAFTAFVEGPSSLLIVYGIATQAPWRWTLQILVSFGQLYGDILYMSTSWYLDNIHTRPEPLYFWFYLHFLNLIWIFIPTAIIFRAAGRLSSSVAATDRVAKELWKKTT